MTHEQGEDQIYVSEHYLQNEGVESLAHLHCGETGGGAGRARHSSNAVHQRVSLCVPHRVALEHVLREAGLQTVQDLKKWEIDILNSSCFFNS